MEAVGYIVINFRGHPNIRATHPTTMQLTTEEDLSLRADCIIGVRASAGCAQLPRHLKDLLKRPRSQVSIRLLVNGQDFSFRAEGHSSLTLTHATDIVVRKTSYTCPRTLAVRALASASDLPRSMTKRLRDPSVVGTALVEVRV